MVTIAICISITTVITFSFYRICLMRKSNVKWARLGYGTKFPYRKQKTRIVVAYHIKLVKFGNKRKEMSLPNSLYQKSKEWKCVREVKRQCCLTFRNEKTSFRENSGWSVESAVCSCSCIWYTYSRPLYNFLSRQATRWNSEECNGRIVPSKKIRKGMTFSTGSIRWKLCDVRCCFSATSQLLSLWLMPWCILFI